MQDQIGMHQPATILRWREVKRRTGLSRATIYRLMARGQFPRQVRLSDSAIGWSEAEVEEWVRSRQRAR